MRVLIVKKLTKKTQVMLAQNFRIFLSCTQGKRNSMRTTMILLAFSVCSKMYAQDSSSISSKLNLIEAIPCSYLKKGILSKEFSDRAFDFILAKDTFAIPALINLLADTSASKVKNLDANTYYKKGDLAFILINYIEWVPFALITSSQWCICCDCGNLPKGFLQYVDNNRYDFQKNYQSYYTSEERLKFISSDKKRLKKKQNR